MFQQEVSESFLAVTFEMYNNAVRYNAVLFS